MFSMKKLIKFQENQLRVLFKMIFLKDREAEKKIKLLRKQLTMQKKIKINDLLYFYLFIIIYMIILFH